MVTGVDLVKSQIRVAAGEKLNDVVGPVEFRGHAIECRINAEDPETFVPSAGSHHRFSRSRRAGHSRRHRSYADAVIPPYYDSLIAKIIAHGNDRAEAIARMNGALEGFVVEGIKTTIPLHKRILADPDFMAGKFDTHFLDRSLAEQRSSGEARLFPALYAILDATPGQPTESLFTLARALAAAGVQLMQLRDKHLPPRQFQEMSRALVAVPLRSASASSSTTARTSPASPQPLACT